MRLIVNSDDFGYSRGHNYGILDCYLAGVLKSTTLMNNAPGTGHAYELAKAYPDLDVGIHFVLTHGQPLSQPEEIPSLVDEKGHFLNLETLREAKLESAEIYLEWSRQLKRQVDNGVRPTHADSHHHVHMLEPVFAVFCRLAEENNLAIRFYEEVADSTNLEKMRHQSRKFKQADIFRGDFYEDTIAVEYFRTLPYDQDMTVEVMAHPAYLDQRIQTSSSYNLKRVDETAVLTSPVLKKLLTELQIECISFKDL